LAAVHVLTHSCRSSAQLQHSLLKVALLLGVRVRLGCDVDALNTALKSPAQLDALDTALPDQRRLAAFSSKGADWRLDVLVDASGGRCPIFEQLGFAQTVALRSARAIGIVISLVNRKSPAELELRESTWSAQYFQHEFRQLELTAGVVLENLVYYRSSGAFADAATHYFVMTTSQDALQGFGALRDPRVTEVASACAPANVDAQRLEAYARAAIVAFVPALGEQPLVPGQLSVFDFSSRRQSSQAAAVVPGAVLGGRQETCCLVTRVGDALQEPFWPEGLGINRGFFHVLDCADMVQQAAPLLFPAHGQPPTTTEAFTGILRRREELYGLTKRLSGTNRLQELKPHHDGARRFCYGLDPATRYAAWVDAVPATCPYVPATPITTPSLALGAPSLVRTSSSRPRMAFHVGCHSIHGAMVRV